MRTGVLEAVALLPPDVRARLPAVDLSTRVGRSRFGGGSGTGRRLNPEVFLKWAVQDRRGLDPVRLKWPLTSLVLAHILFELRLPSF